MLLLTFIIYYASLYDFGVALPLSPFIDVADSALSIVSRGDNIDYSCPRKRIEIIWSCIATIFAASWVSVHPNLPHPQDSAFKKTLRRMELMLWAILTPELIIFWAMRQWYGARKMEKEFLDYLIEKHSTIAGHRDHLETPDDANTLHTDAREFEANHRTKNHSYPPEDPMTITRDVKWTQTHGFFLQMGGFILQEKGKDKHVLGWKTLMEHYKEGRIDISDVTEARINDHSKADAFGKGIALLQTSWFIVQCIARFLDARLVLTELELVTAALALLSLIMYFLWWNKPFNVEIPIIITLSDIHAEDSIEESKPEAQRFVQHKVESRRSTQFENALKLFKRIWHRLLIIIDDGAFDYSADPIDDQEIPALKVPTFYSIIIDSELGWYQMFMSAFCIAALFGAIHCVGWSERILFSSHPASIIWRISSSIITGSPFLWIIFFFCGYSGDKSHRSSLSYKVFLVFKSVLGPLTLLTIPLYILSRAILLVLAFVELRQVPPGALSQVPWASFIPFIH